MTEDEAHAEVVRLAGTHNHDLLARFAALLIEENSQQNLVAASTIPQLWVRHIFDSVQLTSYIKEPNLPLLDIGTGGGFPGLVLAIVSDAPVVLCEPRRRRAEFLVRTSRLLNLTNITVIHGKVKDVRGTFSTITARAVSRAELILSESMSVSERETRWILPVGLEVPTVEKVSKQLVFHVERSMTDLRSSILIADRLR